jgi:hypothetical protein
MNTSMKKALGFTAMAATALNSEYNKHEEPIDVNYDEHKKQFVSKLKTLSKNSPKRKKVEKNRAKARAAKKARKK